MLSYLGNCVSTNLANRIYEYIQENGILVLKKGMIINYNNFFFVTTNLIWFGGQFWHRIYEYFFFQFSQNLKYICVYIKVRLT
jgi:hypothetical protein